MGRKHSKNNCDQHLFKNAEKKQFGGATISQRLGTESQLPFGYCPLSLHPIDDAVVSPTGHMYSRESILEYLLTQTKELKRQRQIFEQQLARKAQEGQQKETAEKLRDVDNFTAAQDVSGIIKRKASEIEVQSSYMESRKKKIDDTDSSVMKQQLKKVSPWVVDFTPEAKDADIPEPPKCPPSPFSGRPLRAKDLVPVNLEKESATAGAGTAGAVRFICPVSRKTITNQKVFLLKNTGTIMIESSFKDIAQPTMQCPVTGGPFKSSDVLELVSAASGYAASGEVVAKKHRYALN